MHRLVFVLTLALATSALAQEPAAPAAEQLSGPDLARVHFDRGTRAYNLGEFAEALAEYKTAYRLHPLPAFLFNIGQCHYALGEYERAIFFYEGFLRESPTSEHRARVEGFIAEARKRDAEKASPPVETKPAPAVEVVTQPGPAPAASAAPSTADESIADAPWFWPTVAGVGVVVAASAVVVAVVASSAPPENPGTLTPIDARGAP